MICMCVSSWAYPTPGSTYINPEEDVIIATYIHIPLWTLGSLQRPTEAFLLYVFHALWIASCLCWPGLQQRSFVSIFRVGLSVRRKPLHGYKYDRPSPLDCFRSQFPSEPTMLDGNYLHILVSPRSRVMATPNALQQRCHSAKWHQSIVRQWDSYLVRQNGGMREEIKSSFLFWFTLMRHGLNFRSIAWPLGVINNTLLALET